MDAKLLGKLTRAEEDLISAMLTEDEELVAYDFAWTSLLDQISRASASGEINSTTLTVADNVVARVSTFVDCCLSLSSIPSPSLPILNLNTGAPSPFRTTSSFIPEAYSWLLENIANPYPSSEFKASLAQRHNSPVSTVSSWFANARRRMGWTALCRDLFRNCRADAVDAAYRVLVKGDPNYQLNSEITHAFVAMRVTAEEFYATSTKSALAGELDVVVKDMKADGKMLAGDSRRGETRKTECLKEREEYSRKQSIYAPDISSQKNLMGQICYPPPDVSHSSSPVPGLDDSLTDESEDEDEVSPPLLAGRKRRLSPSEPAHVASSRVATRFEKRSRFSLSPNVPLSFPLTSTEDSLDIDSHGQMPCSVPLTQSFTNTKTHKRRLSDADTIRLPKRPRDSMAEPRLHAVSDPLPLSTLESEHSIDEWFKPNFDTIFALPPPVDVVEPDLLTQWEVELFNNYIIPESPQKALTPPIQDNRISASTDLTAIDDLLQSLECGGFVALPDIMQPPATASVSDLVSQSLPLLPGLSQTIDWTALLNDFEPTSDPSFHRSYVDSALPEIDLSVLQLPHFWTTVAS